MSQTEIKRKPVKFCGNTLAVLRELPPAVRSDLGFKIDQVQTGVTPTDCKSIKRIGPGAMELRVWSDDGTYRVLYVAKFEEAVYVLHTFKKTTEEISKKDIDVAIVNYKEIF